MLRDTPTGQEFIGQISLAQHDKKRRFVILEERSDEEIKELISNEVLKRDLLESEAAKEAQKNIQKLLKKRLKSKPKPSQPSSSEALELPEETCDD